MQSEPHSARAVVWALPLSLAATYGITVVFSSSGYLDVSVRRVPSVKLWIPLTVPGFFPGGFPHSDTRGSMDICSSPRLFAAYRVFHRLSVPRHPPCALLCLANPNLTVHDETPRHLPRIAGSPSLPVFLSRRIAFRLLAFGSLPSVPPSRDASKASFLGLPYMSLYTASDVSIFRQVSFHTPPGILPLPYLSGIDIFSVFGFQGTNYAAYAGCTGD